MYQENYKREIAQQAPNLIEVRKGDGTMPDMLHDLLVRATPHGLEEHIVNLFPFKNQGKVDAFGNFIITIGDNPETMFSSHMDTVHSVPEKYIKQKSQVRIHLLTKNDKAKEHELGYIWGAVKGDDKFEWDSVQLGADDKVGVFIMCEMIAKKIPGLYVFHVGEEKGGLGSQALVKATPELVNGIKRCIAFDRAGYGDVIAHQRNRRCASVKFTNALAQALNAQIKAPSPTHQYKGDVQGMFTDSANYRDLIPECTNISVGYFNQHTGDERLDVDWLLASLLPACLHINWSELPTERDHKAVVETYSYSHTSHHQRTGGGYQSTAKCKPHLVTKMTPWMDLPDWDPKKGIMYECSAEGMHEIMNKWVNAGNTRLCAGIIQNIMIERDLLAIELQKRMKLLGELEEKVKDDPKQPKLDLTQVYDWDSKGIPTDQVIYNFRAARKMQLIATFLGNTAAIKANKGKQAESLKHCGMKFRKLQLNYKDGKVPVKAYNILNGLLVNIMDVIEATKSQDAASIKEAYADGQKYIKEAWYEPGIPTHVKQ